MKLKPWEAIPQDTCFRCRQRLPKYRYFFNGMVFCSGLHPDCKELPNQTPKGMSGKASPDEVKRIEAYVTEMGYNFAKTFDRYNLSDGLAARICPGRDPKSTRRLLSTVTKRLQFEPWRFVPDDGEDMLNYQKIKEVLG